MSDDKDTTVFGLQREAAALRAEVARLSRLVYLMTQARGNWPADVQEAARTHFSGVRFDADGDQHAENEFFGPGTGNAGWAEYIAGQD